MAQYRVRVEFGARREVVTVSAVDYVAAVRKALRAWALLPGGSSARRFVGRPGSNGWVNVVRLS